MRRGWKGVFLLVFFLLCFIVAPCKTIVTSAQTKDEQVLNEEVLEMLENLDLSALEDYVKDLEGLSDGSLKERLLDYISGEGINYQSFFQDLLTMLFDNVKRMLPAFACVAAVALLCGILQSLQSEYLGKSTAQAVYFIAYLGALIPILAILTECITLSQNTVDSLQKQMSAVFPLMITLMASIGANVSVAIFQPSVAFLSNGMVALIGKVVFPVTIAIIVFSMAGNLFGDLKTDRFSKLFKSVNKWCIGIGISVFGLFLTAQGLTATTYDGIARRAAKYAIGTGVPIVGGFLSGGFDLVVAGGILIKNSLGNFSVFLLISVLLEPITTLVGANLLFRLTAAIAHPFGESKISSFMEETAENLNYCTAGVLFVAFLYFIAILLLVCGSGAFL